MLFSGRPGVRRLHFQKYILPPQIPICKNIKNNLEKTHILIYDIKEFLCKAVSLCT